MRHKIFIAVSAIGIVVILFGAMIRSGVFTPTAPAGWSQIHAGMSREQVLQLVGPPQKSGWPEKIAETWEIKGAMCRHRLFINYRCAESGVGSVQDLCEGTWLPGYGWVHPRIE